jgi:hypothetical protein
MNITKYLSMKKNISHKTKVNELSAVLNEKFKKNDSTINKARIRLMSMVTLALCKVQNVSFHKLALEFDTESKPESSLLRLQRFVASFNLCKDCIARLIFSMLPEKENLKLVIDRTNWQFGKQNINIFMIGIAYKNVAFPLIFSLLNKKGNSNSEERIVLINRFIKLFGKDCIDCIMSDREFVGEKWIGY